MTGTTGSFVGTIKKHKVPIRNLVLLTCLFILVFQFKSSFNELTELIDENQPYIQIIYYQEPLVPDWGQMVPGVVPVGTDGLEHGSFVKTDTLKIYTYKLFQTIFLLFGIFMCIIFISNNNNNFSLIDLIGEKKE